ncbi:MAG: NUDIX domain-containing protein [Oscillospiraceae bacterium]|nr:NUDIX domain-containing protein [Oscillospiraceae bacterium]
MELNYCPVCGARLVRREHPTEPPTAYCERCGDWRFPLFSAAVTAAVWNREHTALLLIWQYGERDPVFPAGYVNKGETAEEAVRRELREELGVELENLRPVCTRYYAPSETLMLHFSAETPEKEARPNEEVDAWRWLTAAEADRLITGGLARELLDDTLADEQNR